MGRGRWRNQMCASVLVGALAAPAAAQELCPEGTYDAAFEVWAEVAIQSRRALTPYQQSVFEAYAASGLHYHGAFFIVPGGDIVFGSAHFHDEDRARAFARAGCEAARRPSDPACELYAVTRPVNAPDIDALLQDLVRDPVNGLTHRAIMRANFCIAPETYIAIARTGWRGAGVGVSDVSQAAADADALEQCALAETRLMRDPAFGYEARMVDFIARQGWTGCRIVGRF